MADFSVPIAEFRFIEMPAQYQPFNPSSDVRRIDGGVPQSSPFVELHFTSTESYCPLWRLKSLGQQCSGCSHRGFECERLQKAHCRLTNFQTADVQRKVEGCRVIAASVSNAGLGVSY